MIISYLTLEIMLIFLINSDGCDSIVNLDLVILNETNVSEISFNDNQKNCKNCRFTGKRK